MDKSNIRTIAIVGGGVTGWMTAAFLAKMLGPSVAISLVDLAQDNDVQAGEATIPPLKAFHHALGINEADFVAKTQGSFKLGTQFVNWGALGNRYFHPHGSYGAEFDAIPLHQWWLKACSTNQTMPSLDALSMSWVLASENRFSPPVPDRRLIQSTFDYAYHMDSSLYVSYLETYAAALGVKTILGPIGKVSQNHDTGFVTELTLKDGQVLTADLFLDCSGSKSVLSQAVLKSGFDDWSAFLPCDTMISVASARGGDFTPYMRATAREAGWQWRSPLQHRTSTGYVFARDFLSLDDAIASLMDNLDGRAIGSPSQLSFKNGKNQRPFSKNVVAIGGAAGFLEPLEATGLHLIQSALFRLLTLWPTNLCEDVVVNEYNKVTALEWELARDFLILHYKATTRTDSPFWRACGEMAIPVTLENRLAHWRAFGRLVSPQPEVFQPSSWLSVLVGQGVEAANWDPLADARENQVAYEARLLGLQRIIADTAHQMPLHSDWIDKNARGARS
jgi:tryptophan 7-halogenase